MWVETCKKIAFRPTAPAIQMWISLEQMPAAMSARCLEGVCRALFVAG
jgi:hypothetical protein